ncbi:hypothetical protein OSB04_025027 [Centaurea solstitialis]|uniref:Uncharacterized protein n=1 Tax=Centaurea solstitialis TaxID=347529 RepID=A0AA38SZK4_9ASTR|nr:hypothetical protein OSB04_025027 [Centaurea solstitialis]
MYAMHCTRPDIAFAVSRLTQYTSNPGSDHWKAIGEYWASKKQTCITHSTMKAEFIALAAARKEAEWIIDQLTDLHFLPCPTPSIPMYCESEATLSKVLKAIERKSTKSCEKVGKKCKSDPESFRVREAYIFAPRGVEILEDSCFWWILRWSQRFSVHEVFKDPLWNILEGADLED